MKILLFAFVLAACAPAEPAPSSEASAPVASSSETAGTTAVADTGRVDLSAIPADLRGCISPGYIDDPVFRDQRVRFERIGEVGFADGSRRVLLEYFAEEPQSNELFKPVVFGVSADGSCLESLPEHEMLRVARAMLDENPAFTRRSIQFNVEAMGGPDGFVRVWEDSRGVPVRECKTDEERNCIPPNEVAAYEDLGVQVAPADSPTADLSAVPDSLHTCIPQGFKDQPIQLHYIGKAAAANGVTPVLLEYFDTSSPVAVQPLALYISEAGCTSGSVWNSDAGIEEAFSLLSTPHLARVSAELHVSKAGGPASYKRFYEALGRDLPRACSTDQEPAADGCLSTAEAEAYRRLGVPIP